MKKIIIILLSFFLLTGCDLDYISPTSAVSAFMKNYKTNSEIVINELDDYLKSEDYSETVLDEYREVYLRQYSNLKYEIVDEIINDDKAFIKLRISVFDYYKTNLESSDFFVNNQSEFFDEDGDINLDKYLYYKMDRLIKTNDRIEYMIDLQLEKNDNLWEIEPLTEETYQKLHGIYEHEI